jgi:hypothetical protein
VGNVLRYGADPTYAVTTNETDSTTAFQNAVDVLYAAGGGTVIMPAGSYGISAIYKRWTSLLSINLIGEGKWATKLYKIGVSTTPIIDFGEGVQDGAHYNFGYCNLSDFSLIGDTRSGDGLRLTMGYRFTIERISIFACDVGLNILGSLQYSVRDSVMSNNSIGVKFRQGGDPVHYDPNQSQFHKCAITANVIGIDIDDSSGLYFCGCDFENNGTPGNAATGAIKIGDNLGKGVSHIYFNDTTFEDNKGEMVTIGDSFKAFITFEDTHAYGEFTGTTASIHMEVGTVKVLTLIRWYGYGEGAGGVGPTITNAADVTIIENSQLGTYTDNSVTTYIDENIRSEAIRARSAVSAEGAVTDIGQVGIFTYIGEGLGYGVIGAHDYDDASPGPRPIRFTSSHVKFPEYTDADLNDVTHFVNTNYGKDPGAMVLNTDLGRPVYAVSGTAGAVWVDGAGVTANTPI